MSSFIVKTIGSTLNATSLVSARYASKKALHLFASPRKGSYSESQLKIIGSAKMKKLKYQNMRIATYNWQGPNQTILLAHGWESNASRWNDLLKLLLAQNYNIVAIDAPAHGQSDGKQFNAILYSEFIAVAAKQFQPKVIIGHSVGGMATVFCNHNHQLDFLDKIVLLGAPAHFTGVFSRYKHMMGYNSKISNGLDNLVMERFGKPVDYFSAANFTANFKTKGLIVHDKHDKIIPYEDALLFANRYKNSELLTTKGLGHGLKDHNLNRTIIDFINS